MKDKVELQLIAKRLRGNLREKFGADFDQVAVAFQLRARIEALISQDVASVISGLNAAEVQGVLDAFEAEGARELQAEMPRKVPV